MIFQRSTAEVAADGGVMIIKQFPPAAIAERGGFLC
jgi:hypothetical protein